MDAQATRFIRNWALACVLVAAVVAGVNVLVDPYLLFDTSRMPGFNARKPSVETQERLMKAYQVIRAEPGTVILGTSRVDMGFSSQHPAWPAAAHPVYNLGLAAANPYTSFRYLQHVMATRHLDLVVLGLDFEYFLGSGPSEGGPGTEFETRLAVNHDGSPNSGRSWQRLRDLLKSTLSLDALLDSLDTVRANLEPDSANLASTGDLSEAALRSDSQELGPYSLFEQRDLRNIRFYYGKARSEQVMTDIREIIDLCASRKTRLILFVNPVHADMLETLDLLGYWPAFEDWKRELASLADHGSRAPGGQPVPLWDFSGYDSFATEAVAKNDRTPLRWFWEPSHYTKELGSVIVSRLFGSGDSQYGVLLSPANVESRLATVREQQRLYRVRQPADARRIRELYSSSVASPSATTAAIQ